MGSYLDSFDIEASLGAHLSPLEVALELKLRDLGDGTDGSAGNYVTLNAAIDTLKLMFEQGIDDKGLDKDLYQTVEELRTIGVNLDGVIKAEITAPADEVTDPETGASGHIQSFTDIFKEISNLLSQSAEKDRLVWIREAALGMHNETYGVDFTVMDDTEIGAYYDENIAPMDYRQLLNVSLILEVIDGIFNSDGDAVFGGEIYYDIEVILDITEISNIKASLFLSSVDDAEHKGDVLSVSVMGVYDEVNDVYDINLFADLTALLGDGLVIKDPIRVSNFSEFTEYMNRFTEVAAGKIEKYDAVALNSSNNAYRITRRSLFSYLRERYTRLSTASFPP